MSCTSEVPRPSSPAICRLDRFRPMKERHNTQIRSGWWCPASTVPLRSSKRDAHAWQRYRCRCGCVSSCPFRTTASLPHPGQRTPSGQRCWRTKAKHFASSSKDARLTGSAVAMMTGTPRVRRPPPTAWNRHHTRTATTSLHHPGSRQEPAWFAWRWPEGFKCPRCAGSTYCEIRGRQLLQCRQCRHQTSLIAGTVLQGTKLPMRMWFRAMHLLAQGKKGLSNIELGRRLGISTNAAWRVQHKLMQAMIERDRRYKLGASGPRIEIDDAYIGGERTGEGSGRGRRGHTPFIIAVETSADRRPLYARLQVVRGFQTAETKRLCARVEPGTTIVSDGGQWFCCIADQPGITHERHVTGSGRTAA